MEQNNETETTEIIEVEVPVNAPLEPISPSQSLDLISDEALISIYEEITTNLRKERDETSTFIDNFAEMVINGGDSSTSSKEALVNLVKARTDITDKMVKVAELKTRCKLKQPYGDVVRARDSNKPGGNTINIYDQSGMNKRSIIDALNKAKKGKENE